MPDSEYNRTALFRPVRVGEWSLPNRIVMAPMTRNRTGVGSVATDLHVAFYAARAAAGLIITEGMQPDPLGQGYPRTPGLHAPTQAASWRPVSDAVHARGGRIVAQLMYCGRISHPSTLPGGAVPVAPSGSGPEGRS